jgi:pimeloyl-ACP methyl ester carboxylesterase
MLRTFALRTTRGGEAGERRCRRTIRCRRSVASWVTMKMFLPAIAIAVVAMVGGAFVTSSRPIGGRLAFAVWRTVSNEAHGGEYATINNVRIYYETYGYGPPVLVLHGGTGTLEDMHYQIRALAATRLVIAADSRGHGRSTDSDVPLSYGLMADDMLKLLDHLNILRTSIVGWSDGGIVALDLAMHHPERVSRLVVIGANYDVDGLVAGPVPLMEIPAVPRFYARNAPDPAHWPVLYRKVVTMWATQPHYTIEDLSRIEAPTLIMAGEFDVVKREHTDRLAKAIPRGEEDIIPGGTHTVVSNEPDIVNGHVLRFLAKASPR